MNCTADVRADGCDIYAPTQFQTFVQMNGSEDVGIEAGASARAYDVSGRGLWTEGGAGFRD